MSNKYKKKRQDIDKINHNMKLELMRMCVIFGKSYEETTLYFESKGVKISHATIARLRKELGSNESTKNWFRKEAMTAMEGKHKLSSERQTEILRTLMQRFADISESKVYTYVSGGEDGSKIKVLNEEHKTDLLMKLATAITAIQEAESKLMSATPMVQAMLEAHESITSDPELKAIIKRDV